MKPNAVQHLLVWSLLIGTIGGAMIALLTLTSMIDPAIPGYRVLFNAGTWLLMTTGASIGAAAGLLTGTTGGWLFSLMARWIPPFRTQQEQLRRYMMLMPLTIIMLTGVSAGIFYWLNTLLEIGQWLWRVLPVLSGLLLLYPVHRYMTRLRRWHMIQPREANLPDTRRLMNISDTGEDAMIEVSSSVREQVS